MKSQRVGVFETNSSSMHSLTIRKNNSKMFDKVLPLDSDGYYWPYFGCKYQFDCFPESYTRLDAKLDYVITLSFMMFQDNCENEQYRGKKRTIIRRTELNKIPDIAKIETLLKYNIRNFQGFKVKSKYFDTNGSNNMLDWFNYNGGINHYELESYGSLDMWLKSNHVTLENFLFNPYVCLNIDNDWN